MPANDIDFIEGKTNPHILLIAPHAPMVNKRPKNDRNTGPITEQIQKKLGCSAIINTVFRKPLKKNGPADLINKRLDFNIISHADLHPTFLDTIKSIVDSNERTLVLWIHGLKNSSGRREGRALIKKKVLNGKPENLHALIGYGQGNDPHTGTGGDRRSAHKATAKKLSDFLTALGMTTKLTRKKATNFRGRDPGRMNQWFNNEGYPLSKVESIQLEIKELRFRDSDANVAKTASIIEKAICQLWPVSTNSSREIVIAESSVDEALVEQSLGFLKDIFTKHFHKAMLEAGEYIIKEFFRGNYELARNPRNAVKGESLNALHNRLEQEEGHAPSKSWIYRAVKLAIDERQFKNLHTYANLGHSQKVLLTYVKEPETKKSLSEEAVVKKFTVVQLRERMAELRNGRGLETISLDSLPSMSVLKQASLKKLDRLELKENKKISHHQEKLTHYQKCLERITSAREKVGTTKT